MLSGHQANKTQYYLFSDWKYVTIYLFIRLNFHFFIACSPTVYTESCRGIQKGKGAPIFDRNIGLELISFTRQSSHW